jgi:hypothetical protein
MKCLICGGNLFCIDATKQMCHNEGTVCADFPVWDATMVTLQLVCQGCERHSQLMINGFTMKQILSFTVSEILEVGK